MSNSADRVSFVKTDHSVTVNVNGNTFTALKDTPEFNDVVKCLKERNYGELPNVISKALAINKYSDGTFAVKDGRLWIKDKMIPTALAAKILEFKGANLPYEPLVKFAENLLDNPSERSVEQLFSFLEKNRHPITSDGHFIAYKSIREDWKDTHSGTFDNSPGTRVAMPRDEVDDNPEQTCSRGLHVANWEYPNRHFTGARLIEVKVNPRDVVAVPVDYNGAKMRVSEYVVMSQVKQARQEQLLVRDDDTDSEDEDELSQDELDEQDDDEY